MERAWRRLRLRANHGRKNRIRSGWTARGSAGTVALPARQASAARPLVVQTTPILVRLRREGTEGGMRQPTELWRVFFFFYLKGFGDTKYPLTASLHTSKQALLPECQVSLKCTSTLRLPCLQRRVCITGAITLWSGKGFFLRNSGWTQSPLRLFKDADRFVCLRPEDGGTEWVATRLDSRKVSVRPGS